VLLRALQLQGFRNLVPTVLAPGSGFNVFVGDNGQGKTNLLEAIYLAGTLRSFRTNHVGEMIAHDGDEAIVRARVERGGLDRLYELKLQPRRKETRLDGKVPQKLADYFGDFNVVLFAPEDLRVPRGNPQGRRRFHDRSVFNREPSFLADAQRYARARKSRNALLRAERVDDALLDAYDAELVRSGARILRSRRRYLAEFAQLFGEAFTAITQSGLAAELVYDAPEPILAAGEDEGALAAQLGALLAASRPRDRARRLTSVGPHADDLEFVLASQPAKAFASQGQLRALVLAWKTAEMRLLRERQGDSPVLLLDDVSSELDATRNRFLFDCLLRIECQCFVTTTHERHVVVHDNRLDFRVVEGEVRSTESTP
jgi:DNA replication and repair protein RecF